MSWTWTGAGLETKLGWNCWNSWPSCSKQRSRHIEAISSHSDEWRHGIYIQKISVSSYIYDNYSHYSDETFFLYRLFFFLELIPKCHWKKTCRDFSRQQIINLEVQRGASLHQSHWNLVSPSCHLHQCHLTWKKGTARVEVQYLDPLVNINW